MGPRAGGPTSPVINNYAMEKRCAIWAPWENNALLGRHGKTRRFESVAENHGGTAEEKIENAMETVTVVRWKIMAAPS